MKSNYHDKIKTVMLYLNKQRSQLIKPIYLLAVMGAFLLSFALLRFFVQSAHAYTADAFVMRVKTNNAGTSGTNQFTIPTSTTSPVLAYSYTVDCDDDGTPEATGVTGNYTCTYATPGEYTMAITGNFKRIFFNNAGDRQKVLEVRQWGTTQWVSMQGAFYGATNLRVTATDAPNLTATPVPVSLGSMFQGATSMNDNINHWDVSRVQNFGSMFYGATNFNQPPQQLEHGCCYKHDKHVPERH